MDIDETTLTNYCEMRREDFGYVAPMSSGGRSSPEAATAIPGALRLFNQAREAGVAVFFITGRRASPTTLRGHRGGGRDARRPRRTWRPQAFTDGQGCGCAMAGDAPCRPSPTSPRSAEQIVRRWLPHPHEPRRPVERSAGRSAGGHQHQAAEPVLFHPLAGSSPGDESGGPV